MYLKKILLENFRNYSFQELDFSEGVNIFLGKNAQGKTNLLEAIYMACRGSSFKNIKENDIIEVGQESSKIEAFFDREGQMKKVDLLFERDKKRRYLINDLEIENKREIRNLFDCVIFSPEDLNIIKGSPNLRRDFLDDLIDSVRPSYRIMLRKYRKILFQRNQLLKRGQGRSYFSQQLESLDRQLVKAGTDLIKQRMSFIELLENLSEPIQRKITSDREDLKIIYNSTIDLDGDIEKNYEIALVEKRDKDIYRKQTGLGPHRDDIVFTINDIPVREFGSQGQKRTVALTLRISELEILEYYKSTSPILLLDDVFSELDEERCAFIISYVKNHQTIITANSLDSLRGVDLDGRTFEVEKGEIKRLS